MNGGQTVCGVIERTYRASSTGNPRQVVVHMVLRQHLTCNSRVHLHMLAGVGVAGDVAADAMRDQWREGTAVMVTGRYLKPLAPDSMDLVLKNCWAINPAEMDNTAQQVAA